MTDNTHWFHGDITRDLALEFFQQLHDFTTEVVINYMPEVAATWPLGNQLLSHDFNPQGAIVHISHSPSMWNTFHMHTRNAHSAHAIIMNGRRRISFLLNHYELLKHLPATVLAPHPVDLALPHSGWLSQKTWGIELRNCGCLRPYSGEDLPPPLTTSEVTDDAFRRPVDESIDRFRFFWRSDMWRTEFLSNVYGWEGYFFERPSSQQVETLLIVLRALNAIAGKLDRRLILPSNCVHSMQPIIPIMPWKSMRSMVTNRWEQYDAPDWVDELFHQDAENKHEGRDLDYYDEGTIAEQLSAHRWRTGSNDGQLSAIDWEKRWLSKYEEKPRYYRAFDALGFDNTDPRFATDVFAISKGMQHTPDQDIYSALHREMDLYSLP